MLTIESWVGHGFPSKVGDTMEVIDAIQIMFLFEMFILALLHTSGITTRESKNPPQG
jgi:hypothetical protein